MPSILGANTLSSGYDVANSARFDQPDGADTLRLAAAGNDGDQKHWTVSMWIKRSKLATLQHVWSWSRNSTNAEGGFAFDTNDQIFFISDGQNGSTNETTDTCTNNFATMNPLNVPVSNPPVLSNGNLNLDSAANANKFHGSSTIGVSKGKWYMEFKPKSGDYSFLGITGDPGEDARNEVNPGHSATGYGYYQANGNVSNNDSSSSYGNSYNSSGDIIGVALNIDDNELKFYKNGTVQNSDTAISITAVASTPAGAYFFAMGDAAADSSSKAIANFGNPDYANSSSASDGNGYGDFEHAPPSGFYSLCTKNLAQFG